MAEMARACGLALFCLTDHDSVAGSAEVAAAWPEGRLVRGLELSCSDSGTTVHLLVYDAERDDARWSLLAAQLDVLARRRRERVHQICARLVSRGIAIDPAAILREAGAASVGRPHVARALVAAGAVKTVPEAFARWLHDGGPADVPIERLSVEEGLELAARAGGRASLAHPHLLGDRAAQLVRRLGGEGGAGLGAIEAHYAMYARAERKRWLDLAREHNMVVTAGSDFHGDGLPQIDRVGVEIEDAEASALFEWLRLER